MGYNHIFAVRIFINMTDLSEKRINKYANSRVCMVWVHKHLSAAQKAVQAGHAIAELMLPGHVSVKKWARRGRTLLIFDGGNSKNLNYIHQTFVNLSNQNDNFHVSSFTEDEATLEGMLTSVALVISGSPDLDEIMFIDEPIDFKVSVNEFLSNQRLMS